MRILLMALVAITLTACSTIRMKYQADVKPEAGKEQSFTHEQSYDVGGANKELCMITGILLGGYCWFYTVMPTVQQKELIAVDAKKQLRKKFLTGFVESNIVIDRMSWADEQVQTELKEIQN